MHRAVFYDLDGTLVRSNIVHTYAYFAGSMPSVTQSAVRILKTVASLPVYMVVDSISRQWFNRFFYANYKGFSKARLRLLGKELVMRSMLPNLYAGAKQRIETAHRQGLLQVLVTGSIAEVVVNLKEFLPLDYFITNHLEYENGRATGRIVPPILAGKVKQRAIREFAKEHAIDLQGSYAFGDSIADLPMLQSVGFPSVVNPDRKITKDCKRRAVANLIFQKIVKPCTSETLHI